ncbi:MAG: alpha/beta hydrolase [Actinobacteria bacterium]|nr:alpha/beta hydrolase [Actinomycetota bacterium]
MTETTADRVGWEPTRTFDVDGVTLAWDRWGPDEGVPLVLVHGFSGSAFDFALRVEALAADRPVITIDHRGHGRSTKPGRLDAYSLDRLVADLAAFVDEHVEGPFDLLGHSMGGVLVQKLVLQHRPAVRRLVLMDTSSTNFVPDDEPTADLIAGFLAAFDPARGLPAAMPPSPEDALIEASTPPSWRERKDELSAGFDPYAMKVLGTALLADGEPLGLDDAIAAIDVPTLVLVGSLDGALVERSDEMASTIPGARLVRIDGAYHSPQLTHPDEWLSALLGHLEGD